MLSWEVVGFIEQNPIKLSHFEAHLKKVFSHILQEFGRSLRPHLPALNLSKKVKHLRKQGNFTEILKML